jgi:serine/threonine protein kinase
VTLYGVCFRPAALVTEFMARGSLFDVIHDAAIALPWLQRLAIVRDIASGMNFLHTTTPPVLHRDLKVMWYSSFCGFVFCLINCFRFTERECAAHRHDGGENIRLWHCCCSGTNIYLNIRDF